MLSFSIHAFLGKFDSTEEGVSEFSVAKLPLRYSSLMFAAVMLRNEVERAIGPGVLPLNGVLIR
jgi:hypothetical protein